MAKLLSIIIRPPVMAWALYDAANSAFATTIMAVVFNRYYALEVAGGSSGVGFLGLRIPGPSLFALVAAAAMAVVAVTAPFLGAAADLAGRRKVFLLAMTAMGIAATAGLATVYPGHWVRGAVLFILAYIGFAGANVFYNSFLVDLASPQEMGLISGFGWGVGYLGGGALLVINLVMLKWPERLGFSAGTFTVRDTFWTVAVWWGIFTLPIILVLREKRIASPPLGGLWKGVKKRLSETISRFPAQPHLVRFLVSFLLFKEGIEAVVLLSSIFGAQELGLSQTDLILFFLVIQGVAFVGSFFMGWLSVRIGIKRTLMGSLLVWMGILVWAYFLGLTGYPVKEFWGLGITIGLVLGGTQALGRAMLGEFTPPGYEGEMFSFLAVVGRAASIFGPLVFAVVSWVTGQIRLAALALALFFLGGFFLLASVDENAGRDSAYRGFKKGDLTS